MIAERGTFQNPVWVSDATAGDAEPSEPTDATVKIEPAEPIDKIEPDEPIDRIEPSIHAQDGAGRP